MSKLFGVDLSMLFADEDNSVQSMHLCAFKADDICVEDMKQVTKFKYIALSYLKMIKLLEDE